eukprot:scaffold417_cov252-Pinguiococcus_pyrenoidosus.AAC.4
MCLRLRTLPLRRPSVDSGGRWRHLLKRCPVSLPAVVVKRKVHQTHRVLDIDALHFRAEPGLCMRRGQADQGLQRTCRDGQRLDILLGAQIRVRVRDLFRCLLGERRVDPVLGISNILPQKNTVENLQLVSGLSHSAGTAPCVPVPNPDLRCVVPILVIVRLAQDGLRGHICTAPVAVPEQDVPRHLPVEVRVEHVQHDEQQVETRKQRVRQADVLLRPPVAVVLAIDGVRCRRDGASRIQCRVDACLRDGHGLLLHHLVNRDAIGLAHLVKLVDAHRAAIREHHRAGLEPSLSSLGIAGDRGGQTHATGSSTRRAHGEWSVLEDRSKKLRLGGSGIANDHDVDVATQVRPVLEVLLLAAEELQDEGTLDEVVTVDGRAERPAQYVQGDFPAFLARFGQSSDGSDILRQQL